MPPDQSSVERKEDPRVSMVLSPTEAVGEGGGTALGRVGERWMVCGGKGSICEVVVWRRVGVEGRVLKVEEEVVAEERR